MPIVVVRVLQIEAQTAEDCAPNHVRVYGFNQVADTKPFPLPWLRQQTSTAGVDLGKADSKTRRCQSTDVTGSPSTSSA